MLKNCISALTDLFKKEKGDITVISKNTKFTGDLESENVYIDGVLNTPELKSVNLVVGKSGIITGNVKVKSIDVIGTVIGDISCESITIHNSAKITGNVSYSLSLTISEGALFEGNISKIKEISEKAGDAKASKTTK